MKLFRTLALMVAAVLAGWFGVASLVAAQQASIVLPAQVEAEDYDAGAAGVAWSDTDGHEGFGGFRTDDPVDAFVLEQVGASGKTLLGRTRDGEFVQYTVEVAAADDFEVRLRVASGADAPGVIHVDVDGARLGTVDVDRNGWFAWETLSPGIVSLDPGSHVVRLTWDEGANINFDWLDFRSMTPQPSQCASGLVEAEDATLAGRFVASNFVGASGGRAVGVARGTGGYFRGAGDSYVEFCTSVETAGEYGIDARVLAPTATKSSFFVSVDDGPLVEFVARATQGNFETFAVNDARALDPLYDKEVADLASVVDVARWVLEPGDHKVRFYLRRDGVQLDNMRFSAVTESTCVINGVAVPSNLDQASCEAIAALLGDNVAPAGLICSWPLVGCEGNAIVSLRSEGGYWSELSGIVPSEIGNLTSLRSLEFYLEPITALPPEVGNLTNLETLVLAETQVATLPAEIGNLTNLTQLVVASGPTSSVPPEITGLANLRELIVFDGQLSSLPPEIANLTNLTSLNLAFNNFSSVPPEIASITNLTSLDMSRNDLVSLPAALGSLDLDFVDLRWNDLRGDISVLSSGLVDGDLSAYVADGDGGNDCLVSADNDLFAVLDDGWDRCDAPTKGA